MMNHTHTGQMRLFRSSECDTSVRMMFVLLGLYVALVIEMYKSEDHHGDKSLSEQVIVTQVMVTIIFTGLSRSY